MAVVPIAIDFKEPANYLAVVLGLAIIYTIHFLIVAKFYRDNLKIRRVLKVRLELIRRSMFLEIMFFAVLGILFWINGYAFIRTTITLPILTYSAITLIIYIGSLIVSWFTSINFFKFQMNKPIEKDRIDRSLMTIAVASAAMMLAIIRSLPPQVQSTIPGALISISSSFFFGYCVYLFRCYKSFSTFAD
ncbi:MAG: hypothetical protein HND51_21970 [Chloroflexi bacterium]|nr:hypothetical protein [Chloroflexota bacterium]